MAMVLRQKVTLICDHTYSQLDYAGHLIKETGEGEGKASYLRPTSVLGVCEGLSRREAMSDSAELMAASMGSCGSASVATW